ncbi:hypothetical protein HGRIS_013013 [Hohenbuehelia grisea]|uniref:Methyltransferase type 11 domain-containing protein n=1 Tax=Hohenbuehelia grisea TaxID=104357 RepID=A0ABR3IUF3_9AGAR
MAKVHQLAEVGFGKGTNELYDRARPSYQHSVLTFIRDVAKAKSNLNIVELGAGTGIFTKALLAHPDWTSSFSQLKAVEPSEGMRHVFTSTVQDERVTMHEGTFDTTHVDNAWADLIIVAQAFHWCPDYDSAAAEFARILKPDGAVVLVWNLEDRDKAQWVAQLRDCIEQHEQGSPQFRLGLWRAVYDTPSYKERFQPPEEKTWSYAIPGTLDLAIDRACSKSYIASLPEGDKAAVVEKVKSIVTNGDEMVWVDKEAGVFEYPYKTYVVVARLQ